MFKIFRRKLSSFKKINSLKLSFTVYKNDQTNQINQNLLIIHGLLGSKQNWNSISKNLCNVFKNVISIDLRNHGDSPHHDDVSIEAMTEDIRLLIDSNGYHDSMLLGHSLGGKVAMYLSLIEVYPNLLKSLVVVDVAPEKTEQIADYKTYIQAMIDANIDQSISLPSNRKNVDDEFMVHIKDSSIRNFLLTNLVKDETNKIIKWRVNLQGLMNGLDSLIEFPCPKDSVFDGSTLFISGANSNYLSDQKWPRIKQLFPRAYMQVINDAGHWVHADKPHEFIKVLTDFAAKFQQ